MTQVAARQGADSAAGDRSSLRARDPGPAGLGESIEGGHDAISVEVVIERPQRRRESRAGRVEEVDSMEETSANPVGRRPGLALDAPGGLPRVWSLDGPNRPWRKSTSGAP